MMIADDAAGRSTAAARQKQRPLSLSPLVQKDDGKVGDGKDDVQAVEDDGKDDVQV